MVVEPLTLFGVCLCGAPSDGDGLACARCVGAWRPFIRAADGSPVSDGELAAALGGALVLEEPVPPPVEPAALPVVPGVEWRANQVCWVCEERRKCRPDPDHPDRWICKNCMEGADQ